MLKANSKIKYMDRTWYPGQEISDVPLEVALRWLMTGEAVGTLPDPEPAEGGLGLDDPEGGQQAQELEVDLQKLEIGELRKMAKEAGVTVPRNAKKTELITILGGGQA